MTYADDNRPGTLGQTYAALRFSGASQARARTELEMSERQASAMERLLHVRRPGRTSDSMRPAFARCRQHLKAVRAQGGFPVLQLGGRGR